MVPAAELHFSNRPKKILKTIEIEQFFPGLYIGGVTLEGMIDSIVKIGEIKGFVDSSVMSSWLYLPEFVFLIVSTCTKEVMSS